MNGGQRQNEMNWKPMRMAEGFAIALLLFFALQPSSVAAQNEGAVELYKDKCMRCHREERRRFVRRTLDIESGTLIASKSRRPVDELLRSHYGVRLTSEETSKLVEMLQQETRREQDQP